MTPCGLSKQLPFESFTGHVWAPRIATEMLPVEAYMARAMVANQFQCFRLL